jgi:hypothetical protein
LSYTHGDKPAFNIRGEICTAGTQAIVLSDQSFPAMLPTKGEEKCLVIMRIENGGILDLVDEFSKQLGNRRIPPGSVILLFSAAHLGNVGLTAYIEDLLEADKMLKQRYGRETRVGPLPPLLLAGCSDPQLTRSLLELEGWVKNYYGRDDDFLEDSHAMAVQMLIKSGVGVQNHLEDRRYRLPSRGGEGSSVWHSGKMTNLPVTINPATTVMEKELVEKIIQELRGKLALALDPSPAFERGLGLQASSRRKVNYLIVGSSHASKVKEELERKGYSTALVYAANWRIDADSAEALASLVRSTIQSQDPEIIVMQLMDNSFYFGRTDDGSMIAATKGKDGIYHLMGAVSLCSKELQLDYFRAMRPLLDAAEKRRVLLITPLPRYLAASCCDDRLHTTNRNDPYFKQRLTTGLEEVRKNVKDFLYYEGRRNVKVMDPAVDIRGLEDGQTWEDDPIHLTPAAYSKLAEGIIKMSSSGAGGPGGGGGARGGRGRGLDGGAGTNSGWRKRDRTESMDAGGGDSRRKRGWGGDLGDGARRGRGGGWYARGGGGASSGRGSGRGYYGSGRGAGGMHY